MNFAPKLTVSIGFDNNMSDHEMPDREVRIEVDINDKTSNNNSSVTFLAHDKFYVKFTAEEFEKIIELYKNTIDIRI